jgi:hypothetical protein
MAAVLIGPTTTKTNKQNSFKLARAERASRYSATSPEITFGLLSALSAAWLSENIRILVCL